MKLFLGDAIYGGCMILVQVCSTCTFRIHDHCIPLGIFVNRPQSISFSIYLFLPNNFLNMLVLSHWGWLSSCQKKTSICTHWQIFYIWNSLSFVTARNTKKSLMVRWSVLNTKCWCHFYLWHIKSANFLTVAIKAKLKLHTSKNFNLEVTSSS